MILSTALFSVLVSASPSLEGQDEWPGWRGPGGNGVAKASLPVEWSEEKNVRWKTEIPGKALSSPIAFEGRIYLTSAVAIGEAPAPEPAAESGGRGGRGRGRGTPPVEQAFLVLALDHASGEVLWEVVAKEATPHEGTHGDASFATPTPTTDGKRLFVSFGSVGIFAYDLEGELLWERDLGDMSIQNAFGEGTSPVLAGDKLVILWQHNGDSFIVALNPEDGEEVWRHERESGTSWCTPTSMETAAGTVVIVPGPTTTAYRAADGEVLWMHPAAAPETSRRPDTGGDGQGGGNRGNRRRSGVVTSAVAKDGVVYLSTSSRDGSFVALHAAPMEASQVAWSRAGDTPYIPSPILYDGILYSLKSNSAILTAMDATTGEVLYTGQRMGGLGDSYASPIAADGKLYFSSRDGTCEVVRAGAEFETLAVNELDDRIDASPAVVGNTLLLRGRTYLYCIGAE